jgi:hypothetical protein
MIPDETNGAPVHAVSQIVREFFERYERSRNTMDAGLIDEQYPDAFTFAGPTGARIAEKQAVIASLSKGHQFLKTLGHRSTSLVSLDEMTLDEHYTLVRAKFVWRFEKPSAQPIDVEVDSTFILYIQDAMPRIVFQQEHEDFQQALRARGVLP